MINAGGKVDGVVVEVGMPSTNGASTRIFRFWFGAATHELFCGVVVPFRSVKKLSRVSDEEAQSVSATVGFLCDSTSRIGGQIWSMSCEQSMTLFGKDSACFLALQEAFFHAIREIDRVEEECNGLSELTTVLRWRSCGSSTRRDPLQVNKG